MRKNLEEIQFTRVFAMLAVLFVHVSSSGLVYTRNSSDLFYIYSFFNTVGKVGVPAFFFLSGLVLLYGYANRPLAKQTLFRFYTNRLKQIILPYLSFTFIYFMVRSYLNKYPLDFGFLAPKFLNDVLLGKGYAHLYFLIVLIQFYILFPLILKCFQKFKIKISVILIGSIVVYFIWYYLNANYFKFGSQASLFVSYLSFFLLGAAIGQRYDEIKEKWKNHQKKWNGLIIVGFILSLALINFNDMSLALNPGGWWFNFIKISNFIYLMIWTFYGIMGSIFILLIGEKLTAIKWEKGKSLLHSIANDSFGIYFIHPLFLLVFRYYTPTSSGVAYHGWQLFTAVAITLLSILFVQIVRKLKLSWLLLGK